MDQSSGGKRRPVITQFFCLIRFHYPCRCRLTDAVAGDVSPGKRCPPDKRFPSAHRIYRSRQMVHESFSIPVIRERHG